MHFYHIHLMRCLSSVVNIIAVTTLLLSPVCTAVSKEHLIRIQIILDD